MGTYSLIASILVPFCGLDLGSHKEIPTRNYDGAYGYMAPSGFGCQVRILSAVLASGSGSAVELLGSQRWGVFRV